MGDTLEGITGDTFESSAKARCGHGVLHDRNVLEAQGVDVPRLPRLGLRVIRPLAPDAQPAGFRQQLNRTLHSTHRGPDELSDPSFRWETLARLLIDVLRYDERDFEVARR